MNTLPDLRDIRLDGYVGGRLRSCFENHVVKTDGVYLTDPSGASTCTPPRRLRA